MVSIDKIEFIERNRIRIRDKLIPLSETYKGSFLCADGLKDSNAETVTDGCAVQLPAFEIVVASFTIDYPFNFSFFSKPSVCHIIVLLVINDVLLGCKILERTCFL